MVSHLKMWQKFDFFLSRPTSKPSPICGSSVQNQSEGLLHRSKGHHTQVAKMIKNICVHKIFFCEGAEIIFVASSACVKLLTLRKFNMIQQFSTFSKCAGVQFFTNMISGVQLEVFVYMSKCRYSCSQIEIFEI